MLGAGEQLRKLTVTVEQLLDRSANDVREWEKVWHNLITHIMLALTLFPKDGDVRSPCSSVLITVKRKCENGDSLASRVLGPRCVSMRVVSTRSLLISVCP